MAKSLPNEISCKFPCILAIWPLASRSASTGRNGKSARSLMWQAFRQYSTSELSCEKTQLQAPKFSEKSSSNLLHRFWVVSIDSGRCLLKLPAERGRIAQKCAEFLAPIGLQEVCQILSGPGAVPRPTKVRCLEETRHLAELSSALSGAEWRGQFLKASARWRATALAHA